MFSNSGLPIKAFAALLVAMLPMCDVLARQATITGTVVDAADRTPLVGAHVVSFKNWREGTTTDEAGGFSLTISGVFMGDTLVIKYMGYQEMLVTIATLQQNKVVKLNPIAENMEQVTVTSERIIAEEFVVKKISQLDIYKNPSAKADPLLAVNAMPSSTTVDETASVSFRGSSPVETGIFLNHVPVYDAVRFAQLGGIGTFSFLNTEIIGSLLVFPGNPPLEYGNTSSGLVAIQTLDNVVEKNRTSLALSLAVVGLNHQQKISEKQSITLYGNYQPSGVLRAVNPVSLKAIKRFETLETGIHYVNQLSPTLSLKSFHYFLDEGYTFNFRSPTYTGNFVQDKHRMLHIVNLSKKWRRGSIGLNMGWNQSRTNLKFSRTAINLRYLDTYGSLTYHVQKKRAGWKAGVAYDTRTQRFDGLISEFPYAIGLNHPVVPASSYANRRLPDGFFSFKYTPSSLIAFGWALRKNVPIDGRPNTLAYQSSVSVQAHKNHRITFGSGTFHQLALIQEEGVVAIKTQQWVADHTFALARLSGANALFYKKNFKGNTKTATLGVETWWKYQLGEKWQADVSYSFIHSIEEEGEETRHALYDLDYFVRGGIQWSQKGWTVGSRYVFRQGTWHYPLLGAAFDTQYEVYVPYQSADQARNPAYNLIDFSMSKLISLPKNDGLVLFASMSNVLDWKNTRSLAYNADYSDYEPELFNRRTIYFGLMWVWQ